MTSELHPKMRLSLSLYLCLLYTIFERVSTNSNLARRTLSGEKSYNPEINEPTHNDPKSSYSEKTCEKMFNNTLNQLKCCLKKEVDFKNILPSLPFDVFSSLNISTCGHYVHISCYQHYIAALKREASLNPDEITEDSIPIAGMDFDCPVCRQNSNFMLLNYDTVPMKHNFTKELIQVEEIYELIKSSESVYYQRFHPIDKNLDLEILHDRLLEYYSSFLEKGLVNLQPKINRNYYNALSETSQIKFNPADKGELSFEKTRWLYTQKKQFEVTECDLKILLTRIVSSCIEMELNGCTNGLITLGRRHRVVREIPIRSLLCSVAHSWSEVYGSLNLAKDEGDFSANWLRHLLDPLYSKKEIKNHLPAILTEPSQYLIQLAIALFPLNEKVFLNLVGNVFSLAYVQILVIIIGSMPSEDRSFWKMSAASNASSGFSLDITNLMTHVLRRFDRLGLSKICFPDNFSKYHQAVNSNSFRSKEDVENFTKSKSIPFLQTAAVLYQNLYNKPKLAVLDYSNKNIEFDMLVKFMNLSPEKSNEFSVAQCVRWSDGNSPSSARNCINIWLENLTNSLHSNCYPVLESLHLSFIPMKLVKPPEDYTSMYVKYVTYGKNEDDSCKIFICLCCGDTFLQRIVDGKPEGVMARHSVECNFGSIVYLDVLSTDCLVMRGKYISRWGTLYLDGHGESDRDLVRGKPLFLQEDRFSLLEKQWITNSIDDTCTSWVEHKDRF